MITRIADISIDLQERSFDRPLVLDIEIKTSEGKHVAGMLIDRDRTAGDKFLDSSIDHILLQVRMKLAKVVKEEIKKTMKIKEEL